MGLKDDSEAEAKLGGINDQWERENVMDYETDEYFLDTDSFGCYILTRKRDGKSAFFQGEDADLWERNIRAICKVYSRDDALDKSFNFLCSGYDDILE